jgi:GT2 family glycosyltransferase
MVNIFVVILNWNRKKLTGKCLESLANIKVKGFIVNVLIIDNASSDGSVNYLKKKLKEIISRKKFLSGKVIVNDANFGYAAGMNVGLKYAMNGGADYIIALNNDIILDRNLIMELLKTAQSNKDAGVMCPKIYFAKGFEFHKGRYKKNELGKVIWYAGGDIDWANMHGVNHGVDVVDKGQYDNIRETDFATGNCMFFNKNALEAVGLFDEKYFMYLEDMDLSLRMSMNNWKVLYVPSAVLWHKVAQSSGIGSEHNDYFISRNRLLFGLRYASTRTNFALFRESIRLLLSGRKWQKMGIRDFYMGRFGKGSWLVDETG